mgnify:FL=1
MEASCSSKSARSIKSARFATKTGQSGEQISHLPQHASTASIAFLTFSDCSMVVSPFCNKKAQQTLSLEFKWCG